MEYEAAIKGPILSKIHQDVSLQKFSRNGIRSFFTSFAFSTFQEACALNITQFYKSAHCDVTTGNDTPHWIVTTSPRTRRHQF